MEGEVDEPECEHSLLCVPKKEVPINPINPCGELAMLTFPQDKNQAL